MLKIKKLIGRKVQFAPTGSGELVKGTVRGYVSDPDGEDNVRLVIEYKHPVNDNIKMTVVGLGDVIFKKRKKKPYED